MKGDETMDSRELFGEATETVEENFHGEEVNQENLQEDTSKKGNSGAVVAVVTLLFILVIGLCVYIAVNVSKMLPQPGQEDKEYEAQTQDPWKELLGDDYIEGNLEEDWDAPKQEYPNYEKDYFSGPYYEEVVDCIDETVSYKVKREFRNVSDEKNSIDIHTSYIQLEGDIPGVEEINRLLEEQAVYFVESYEESKEELHKTLEDTGTGIQAEIRSYVTYNTESEISIVIREDISLGYMYRDVALRSFNFNLDTGMLLDNTSILDLSDFGAQFRERSNAQNGVSESGIEAFSDEEIEAMLTDEDALIIFYTPLGMEIGYNYRKDGTLGWITITMQDYEEYIMKM